MATFGRGDTSGGAYNVTVFADYLYMGVATLSEDGTATSMTLYCDGGGSGGGDQTVRLVIYDDDGDAGVPYTLLAQSDPFTILDADGWGWRGADLVSPAYLSAGNYWLGVHTSTTSQGARYDYYTPQANTSRYVSDAYSNGPANPTAAGSLSNKPPCILVTYTATPTGISIPLLNNLLLGD